MPKYYMNRSLCEVFEEMRTCVKTLNFSYLLSLIEEAQMLGSRMEAALGDKNDIIALRDERSELKKEVMKLRKEKKKK